MRETWSDADGPTRGSSDEPAWRVITRGADRVTFDARARASNRALYRELIAPVRKVLPARGGLLTIVPHGPLFRLAFAALIDPAGRYLLEEWPLHYAASVSALEFTAGRHRDQDGLALVVADPAIVTGPTDKDPLPRLPGAAREGQQVAKVFGSDRSVLLQGATATEARVREAASTASVIHFATHSVLRDDQPFETFLALAGPATTALDNGRLTMGEVYGLRLRAELVVLSACRSALGPVSGDGIVGLTRGFFAAGTSTVIASLWDLPDAVTATIFPKFYSSWRQKRTKAEALRQAQLDLLRELRAGRVSIDTPAGRLTIPEHPSLWAGLVLVGEP